MVSNFTRYRAPISLFFAMCVGAVSFGQAIHHKPLTTVQAVIHLSSREAQSGIPVRLRGQITYVDLEWDMMFLRGATGPVFVVLPRQTSHLQAGDVVVVNGITGTALAGNFIQHIKLRVLSRKPLPTPATVSLAALRRGADESEYVSTEGVLRQNQFLWDHTHLLLVDGHTSIPIVIPGGVNTEPLRYVGNLVTVRGVAGAQTNSKGARVGTVLYLQNADTIQPTVPKWRNIFRSPAASIDSLGHVNVTQRFLAAVHLRGQVLWRSADKFVLEDRSGTILVQTPSTASFRAGDQLDVVGFPVVVNGIDRLQDASIRKLGEYPQSPEHPRQWSLARVLHHGKDGDSVTLSGTLIAESAENGFYAFTIEDHDRRFEVLAAAGNEGGRPLTIRPGAKVQATGTLRLLRHVNHQSDSIQLLVKSPDDIVVESGRRVNWEELLLVLGGCIVLGIAFWIFQMRRTLRVKTALIRAQMVQESQLEDKYRRLFERSPTSIFIWRPSGEITDCNPAFARMMGFRSAAEVVGKSYWSLLTDEAPAQLATSLEAGTVNDRESSLRRTDGRTVYLLENVTRVETDSGHHYETTALDVTQSRLDWIELQRARIAAQREAEVDTLTGLSNRRRFSQVTRRELELAAKQRTGVALLFLDLDEFKVINDTLGHLIGDVLLQQVAERLKNQLSARGMLSRVGGDEFAVLLREFESVADPEHVAAAMLQSLAVPFRVGGRDLSIGASIGISLYPDLAADYTNLLQQADSAMYVAKQSGRNRAVRYNDDIGRALQEKSQIISELKGAIARREISLHYQPEFNSVNRHITRFEALARWNSSLLGNVPPVKFISVAEESGFIVELGRYLLELACRDAFDWQLQTGQHIPVAVNISVLQLRDEGFVEMVLDILKRTGLAPASLELEMTESIMLDEFAQCREVLTHLRALGIRMALDDFGTGYSNLSYLPKLPFDRLKTDRSFLEEAHCGRGCKTLIETVIGVARRLGMSVVVEGIETSEELEFVSALGADEVQGYFLGRPGPDPRSVIEKHSVHAHPESHAKTETTGDLLPRHRLNITNT